VAALADERAAYVLREAFDYVAAYLHTLTGPIVLVGHSYGGAVITNAATGVPNIRALVYVDGFAPDEGEAVATISYFKGGHLGLISDPKAVTRVIEQAAKATA